MENQRVEYNLLYSASMQRAGGFTNSPLQIPWVC